MSTQLYLYFVKFIIYFFLNFTYPSKNTPLIINDVLIIL